MAKGLGKGARGADAGDDTEFYVAKCRTYSVQPDAGVIACIKLQHQELVPHRRLSAEDMMPLSEVLPLMKAVTAIDLSNCSIGVAGAQVLAEALRSMPSVSRLDLQGCHLGARGCAPILELMASKLCNLTWVNFRANSIGSAHAKPLRAVIEAKNPSLQHFDLSSNGLGESTVRLLESLLDENNADLNLDTEGNFFLAELLNSVTHGLGFLLALQGTFLLLERGIKLSYRHAFAVGVYGVSLCLMYLSSTLYHCLFKLRLAKSFFKYLDHSCIFSLIAGTYTPFMLISLHSMPWISYGLLSANWAMCFLGMYISIAHRGNKSFDHYVIALYLLMGWSVVIPGHAILSADVIPFPALMLVVSGGVFYSVGVLFVVADSPFHHVIWHFFVLVASALHFFAIFWYVLPSGPVEQMEDAIPKHLIPAVTEA